MEGLLRAKIKILEEERAEIKQAIHALMVEQCDKGGELVALRAQLRQELALQHSLGRSLRRKQAIHG